jgi:hypothetical protein
MGTALSLLIVARFPLAASTLRLHFAKPESSMKVIRATLLLAVTVDQIRVTGAKMVNAFLHGFYAYFGDHRT